LETAKAKLATVDSQLAALATERATTLAESDDIADVVAVDAKIADATKAAAILKDRIETLEATIRQQAADEHERARQAGIVEIEKRITEQVKIAKRVEAAVQELGDSWNELIGWRSAIVSKWPPGLPLPLTSDFEDLRALRRSLAEMLHSSGRPSWDRQCSIPAPAAPVAVAGVESRGIANAVAAAGAAFIARLRAQRVASDDHVGPDEEKVA
jgi:hypothetical protein